MLHVTLPAVYGCGLAAGAPVVKALDLDPASPRATLHAPVSSVRLHTAAAVSPGRGHMLHLQVYMHKPEA